MNLAGYKGETRMAQYSFETTTITQLTRSAVAIASATCSFKASWTAAFTVYLEPGLKFMPEAETGLLTVSR